MRAVLFCLAWCLLVCGSDAVATAQKERNADAAASEIKKTVEEPAESEDDVEGAEYREFQQVRFHTNFEVKAS